jgi:hypothetical protein
MTVLSTIRQTCLLMTMAVLLAACGGGGDGSSSTTSSSAPLTRDNAEAVAGRVVASVDAIEGASTLGGGLTGMAGGTLGRRSAALTMQANQPCPGGGSMSFAVNMALPETLSANDSVSADFDSCRFSTEDPQSLSGGISCLVAQASGNPDVPPFDVTLTYDFDRLEATTPGEGSAGVDGGFSARVRSDDGVFQDVTITASSVRVSEATNWVTLSGYVFDATHNMDTGEFTVTVTGTLSSSAFGGAVTFDTLVPVTGQSTVPSAGEILLTGAGGSSILVKVMSENTVELHVDENGDGTVDAVIATTWETLES